MSKDITKCQNLISSEDCETHNYIEQVLEKCHCLPANFEPIYRVISTYISLDNFTGKLFQEPHCDAAGEKCVAGIKPNSKACMTPCKGIYADVKKTPYIDTGFSFDVLHENYSHYKRFKEEEIKFPSGLKGLSMYDINVL